MYKIRDYKEIKNRNEKIKKIISIYISIKIYRLNYKNEKPSHDDFS